MERHVALIVNADLHGTTLSHAIYAYDKSRTNVVSCTSLTPGASWDFWQKGLGTRQLTCLWSTLRPLLPQIISNHTSCVQFLQGAGITTKKLSCES